MEAALASTLHARWRAGERAVDIAREAGLPYGKAYPYIVGKKVPGRKRSGTFTDDERAEIRSMLALGMQQKEIAEEIGCTQQAVSRVKLGTDLAASRNRAQAAQEKGK